MSGPPVRAVLLGILATVVAGPALAQSAGGVVPGPVSYVAEKAEDAIDLYQKQDWADAKTIVDGIVQREDAVSEALARQHMPASSRYTFEYLVFRLQELTKRRSDPIQAALIANQMTALTGDLEARYPHTVPEQVGRMDYLGREIALLAAVPDSHGLTERRVTELAATWSQLRPAIVDRSPTTGDEIAVQVDHIVNALKKGGTNEQMATHARQILDFVDEIENLYQ